MANDPIMQHSLTIQCSNYTDEAFPLKDSAVKPYNCVGCRLDTIENLFPVDQGARSHDVSEFGNSAIPVSKMVEYHKILYARRFLRSWRSTLGCSGAGTSLRSMKSHIRQYEPLPTNSASPRR